MRSLRRSAFASVLPWEATQSCLSWNTGSTAAHFAQPGNANLGNHRFDSANDLADIRCVMGILPLPTLSLLQFLRMPATHSIPTSRSGS
jgi:hypothetical protein